MFSLLQTGEKIPTATERRETDLLTNISGVTAVQDKQSPGKTDCDVKLYPNIESCSRKTG